MSFAKGCQKPLVEPHKVKLSFRSHEAMRVSTLPESIDYRALGLLPPVKNQGQSGSCSPHRTSTGIWTRAKALGKPLSFMPSENDLYKNRELDRARSTPIGQELPKLGDVGSQTEDVILWIANVGIKPRDVPQTSDGRDSDVEDAVRDDGTVPFNDDSQFGALEEDAKRIVVMPPKHAIDPNASDTIDQCRASLAALIPLWTDFWCDTGFENWAPSMAPYGTPNMSDPQGGGHAVMLAGYARNPDGSYKFLLDNSWGTDIAEQGFWWVSEAWMRAAWAHTPGDTTVEEAS